MQAWGDCGNVEEVSLTTLIPAETALQRVCAFRKDALNTRCMLVGACGVSGLDKQVHWSRVKRRDRPRKIQKEAGNENPPRSFTGTAYLKFADADARAAALTSGPRLLEGMLVQVSAPVLS